MLDDSRLKLFNFCTTRGKHIVITSNNLLQQIRCDSIAGKTGNVLFLCEKSMHDGCENIIVAELSGHDDFLA